MQRLNAWLSALLKDRGEDLFRSKGILSVAGSDDRHVFQGGWMGGMGGAGRVVAGWGWALTAADIAESRLNKQITTATGVHMMLQFTSSAEGVGHPWGPGESCWLAHKWYRGSLCSAPVRVKPLITPTKPNSLTITTTDEKRVNKLCFIGKNLNRQELTDSFNACLEPAAAAVSK
jgi:G3E family GTPase